MIFDKEIGICVGKKEDFFINSFGEIRYLYIRE